MTNASGRDTAYSGVVDDVSHHHYVQKFALQDEKIPTRKLVYIVCLLLALRIIQRGTDATIFDTIQLHEPSNRIFRSLFEVVLLLVCCSASIYVWIRYIPLAITENLLFQPAESSLFASLTTSYDDEVSNNLNGAHGDDLFQSEGAGDSKSITQQQDAKKYDQNLELESKDMLSVAVANFEVEGTTITSSRDKAAKNSSPIAILGSALDLLVWSLVALVLYMVTAIEAVDARPSEESNNLVSMLARIAAPTFPLLLFLFTAVRTVHPWRSRVNIIEIVSYTISAPFYEVTFRDGMIVSISTQNARTCSIS